MQRNIRRRPGAWAACTLLTAVFCAGASGGCGKKAGPSKPGSRVGGPERPERAAPIAPERVSGRWQWSHLEEANGVRRIENERWQLRLAKDTLKGHYDRVVTFISLDGVPFECSQALSYRLVTHYDVIGTVDSRHFDVAERAYRAEPSPCEGGYRRMGEYQGFLIDDNVVLKWSGGQQTLVRSHSDLDQPTGQPTPAGAWSWRNRATGTNGTVRVEAEEWDLAETEGGRVTGTVLRTVTVFDPKGAVFDCGGDTYYQYRDRYTVRGTRAGTRLLLTEVDVDAGSHPCVTHTERHLDSATGTIGASFLQLEWRGRHRQVLHRPGSRAPAK